MADQLQQGENDQAQLQIQRPKMGEEFGHVTACHVLVCKYIARYASSWKGGRTGGGSPQSPVGGAIVGEEIVLATS